MPRNSLSGETKTFCSEQKNKLPADFQQTSDKLLTRLQSNRKTHDTDQLVSNKKKSSRVTRGVSSLSFEVPALGLATSASLLYTLARNGQRRPTKRRCPRQIDYQKEPRRTFRLHVPHRHRTGSFKPPWPSRPEGAFRSHCDKLREWLSNARSSQRHESTGPGTGRH